MLSQEVEGRQVVQVTSRDFVALMAPSLNFHTLVKRKISTGYYEIYRNVTIVEPSSDLFEPPGGVELRRTETVAGIEVIVPPAKWRRLTRSMVRSSLLDRYSMEYGDTRDLQVTLGAQLDGL